jgi:hypothetical protein
MKPCTGYSGLERLDEIAAKLQVQGIPVTVANFCFLVVARR